MRPRRAKLSAKRKKGAKAMSAEINQQLQQLSMEGAELLVQLSPMSDGEYRSGGLEEVEFLLATNPGQQHKAFGKNRVWR